MVSIPFGDGVGLISRMSRGIRSWERWAVVELWLRRLWSPASLIVWNLRLGGELYYNRSGHGGVSRRRAWDSYECGILRRKRRRGRRMEERDLFGVCGLPSAEHRHFLGFEREIGLSPPAETPEDEKGHASKDEDYRMGFVRQGRCTVTKKVCTYG
jgi:hypothetical protein